MENQQIENQDQAQLEADTVKRYAEFYTKDGSVLNPDHYITAQTEVEQLMEKFGSIESVGMYLDAYQDARELGLEKQFERAEITAAQSLKEQFPEVIMEIISANQKGLDIVAFCEALAVDIAAGKEEIFLNDPDIGEAYEEDSEKMSSIIAKYIAIIKDILISLVMKAVKQELAKPAVTQENMFLQIEDFQWPNGNKVKFVPEKKVTLDGCTVTMSKATLTYKKKAVTDPVTIDLSSQVPNKTILFAQLNPDLPHHGLTTDLVNEAYCFLNLREITRSNAGIVTLFHEIGHVYTYKLEADMIASLARPDEDMEPQSNQSYVKHLRLIKADLADFISRFERGILDWEQSMATIHGKVGCRDEENRAKLDQYIALNNILITGTRVPRLYMNQLRGIHPNLAILLSAFQERNAQAYAIKAMRRLDPDIYMLKERIRTSTRKGLEFGAKTTGSAAFTDGVKDPENN